MIVSAIAPSVGAHDGFTDYPSPLYSVNIDTGGVEILPDVSTPMVYRIFERGSFGKPGRLIFSAEGIIEPRGNNATNSAYPKKQYKFEFTVAKSLVGMGSHKNWIHHGLYHDDRFKLRHKFTFEVAQFLGTWNEGNTLVEYDINGVYWGTGAIQRSIEYQHLGLAKNDVTTDPDKGWIVRLDHYGGNDGTGQNADHHGDRLNEYFPIKKGIFMNYVYPKAKNLLTSDDDAGVLTTNGAIQTAFIKAIFEDIQDRLDSVDFDDSVLGWANKLDAQSMANAAIILEWSKIGDNELNSHYFARTTGGKLKWTAPHDFDFAYGDADHPNPDFAKVMDPTGWLLLDGSNGVYGNMGWLGRMYQGVNFQNLVKSTWATGRQTYLSNAAIRARIMADAELINAGPAQRNEVKWGTLTTNNAPFINPPPITYMAQVERDLEFIIDRADWFDTQWL